MTSHARAQFLVSARMDGPLAPAEARELQVHLLGCPACRRFAEQTDALARGLRGLPQLAPSPNVSRQVLEAVATGRSPWSRLFDLPRLASGPALAAAGSLVLIAALAFTIYLALDLPGGEEEPEPGQLAGIVVSTETPVPTPEPTPEPTPTAEPTPTEVPDPTPTATAAPDPTATVARPTPARINVTVTITPEGASDPAAAVAQAPAETAGEPVSPTVAPAPSAPPSSPPTIAAIDSAGQADAAPTETPVPVPTDLPEPTVLPEEAPSPTVAVGPPTATAPILAAVTAASAVPAAITESTPLATAAPDPTATAAPPTESPTPTETPVPAPTATPRVIVVEEPVLAPSPTPEPTATPPVPTATATPEPIPTAVPTATATPEPSPTPPPTLAPEPTPPPTPTPLPAADLVPTAPPIVPRDGLSPVPDDVAAFAVPTTPAESVAADQPAPNPVVPTVVSEATAQPTVPDAAEIILDTARDAESDAAPVGAEVAGGPAATPVAAGDVIQPVVPAENAPGAEEPASGVAPVGGEPTPDPAAVVDEPAGDAFAPADGGTIDDAGNDEVTGADVSVAETPAIVAVDGTTPEPVAEPTADAVGGNAAPVIAAVPEAAEGGAAAGTSGGAVTDDGAVAREEGAGVTVVDPAGGTFTLPGASAPVWSPLGGVLLVTATFQGNPYPTIAIVERGSGQLQPLAGSLAGDGPFRDLPAGWVGSTAYYQRVYQDGSGRVELRAYEVTRAGDLGPVWVSDGDDGGPFGAGVSAARVSPDGARIAYLSGGQLFVAPLSDPADAAQPVPADGVVGFDWSADGRRLLLGDGTAVSVGDPQVGP